MILDHCFGLGMDGFMVNSDFSIKGVVFKFFVFVEVRFPDGLFLCFRYSELSQGVQIEDLDILVASFPFCGIGSLCS